MANVKVNDLANAASVTDTMQFETDITGTVSNKVLATVLRTYCETNLIVPSYITVANTATLTNERALAVSANLSTNDAGAGSTFTIGTGAFSGDVTTSANSFVCTIANTAVTYAKMQNTTAASIILGRGSAAGAGVVQEITLSADMLMSGTVLGVNTNVVRTGQDNTYTAGKIQSVSHDATNPGLRIAGAAGDPASAGNGDIWYNSTTGKLRTRQAGTNFDVLGGGGAPTNAQYLTLTTDGTLSDERTIAAGLGLSGTDAGAGSTYTLAFDSSEFTEETANAELALDRVVYYDSSAATTKSIKWINAPPQNVRRHFYQRHDLAGVNVGASATVLAGDGLLGETNNTSSAVNSGTGTATKTGVANFVTGTTGGGRASVRTAQTAVLLGSGTWTYECLLQTPSTLSDGTETYHINAGFYDDSTTDSVDGVYFRYNHTTNSGKWQAYVVSNSSNTTADTGITVSTSTWYLLRIEINSDATSVTFYIDGSSVATITTNIPSGAGRTTGYGMNFRKSLGTTSRTMSCDYIQVTCDYTAARS